MLAHHQIQVIVLALTQAASSLLLLYNAYPCPYSCFGQSWSQHFCHGSLWQQYHKLLQLLLQFLFTREKKRKTISNWIKLFSTCMDKLKKNQALRTECSQVNVSSSSNQSYACLPPPIFLPSIIGQNFDLVPVVLQNRKGNPSKFEQTK